MAAAMTLPTPLGRRVKVVEHGTGTPVVFLHSGVGSAGEWKQVFTLWPEGYRLVTIEAYRDGTGPGVAGRRSLDDYADQVYAVAEHVGVSVCLVGFSWGGATALRVATHAGRRRLHPDLWPARSVARARSRGAVVRGLRGVRRLLQRARLVRSVAAPAPQGVSRCPAGLRRHVGRSLRRPAHP